jgi:hypothetical protein
MVLDPHQYGKVVIELIENAELPPLGPGTPNPDEAVLAMLDALSPETLFATGRVSGPNRGDPDMGACCVTGLWLLHNYLTESHTLSQCIETQEGSYWHGIMHRREPDFSNAKYWFHRVGEHPVYEQMPAAVVAAGGCDGAASELASLGEQWDPMAFIDLCEEAIRGGSPELTALCRKISQAEWRILFDFCFQRAA